jgi:hypothetical protein
MARSQAEDEHVAIRKISAFDTPRDTPESVGMSSARLRRIGAALEREIVEKRIPGAVVAIQRHSRSRISTRSARATLRQARRCGRMRSSQLRQ